MSNQVYGESPEGEGHEGESHEGEGHWGEGHGGESHGDAQVYDGGHEGDRARMCECAGDGGGEDGEAAGPRSVGEHHSLEQRCIVAAVAAGLRRLPGLARSMLAISSGLGGGEDGCDAGSTERMALGEGENGRWAHGPTGRLTPEGSMEAEALWSAYIGGLRKSYPAQLAAWLRAGALIPAAASMAPSDC